MGHLGTADKLLEKKPAAALDALLEAWRETFDPAIADLVERLGASLAKPIEGLSLKQAERSEQLAELAQKGSAANRSAVLQAFELFAASAQGQKVWPSVEAWAEVEPDPRVGRTALKLLTTKDAVRDLTGKLLRRLVNCVERHGDAGLADAMEASGGAFGGWLTTPDRFKNVAAKLRKKRSPQPIDDPGALERLGKRIPPLPSAAPAAVESTVTEQQLLDAVLAAPDDDTPRLMYADWLTERQDPRGEFIVLQVNRARGKVTKEAQRREAELFAQHRSKFLGELDKFLGLGGLRFERGFVARASARRTVPAHPLLRLVHDLEFRGSFATAGVRFDSLRVARRVSLEDLGRLMDVAPRLERVELGWGRTTGAWPERPLAELEVPATRDGSLDELLATLFARPLVARARAIGVTYAQRVTFSRATLAKAPATLARLSIEASYPSLRLVLEREPPGPWQAAVCTVPDSWNPESVRDLLAGAVRSALAVPGLGLTVRAKQKSKSVVASVVNALGPDAKRVTLQLA